MENQLFRQKSIDHISSPEALHDYMRVTSPRLWMILGAIAVLLVGFIVYASTATMENLMPMKVKVETLELPEELLETGAGQKLSMVYGRVPMSELSTVKIGMKVRVGTEEGTIGWISTIENEDEINLIFDMDRDYIPLPDGEYDADLVLESTTAISFLWN